MDSPEEMELGGFGLGPPEDSQAVLDADPGGPWQLHVCGGMQRSVRLGDSDTLAASAGLLHVSEGDWQIRYGASGGIAAHVADADWRLLPQARALAGIGRPSKSGLGTSLSLAASLRPVRKDLNPGSRSYGAEDGPSADGGGPPKVGLGLALGPELRVDFGERLWMSAGYEAGRHGQDWFGVRMGFKALDLDGSG
jgi:hypothetical protein